MMHMQWGDETKARAALENAWKLDPFNERTKNTLDLLDRLEAFATLTTDHFVIHYDAARDELIARKAAEHLEGFYADVTGAFGATLTQKTTIEIFPTQGQFAVRITGKPWIHTVGACTGWVIALAAPRHGSDLMGPYNFADVLRHEFAHTVTLAATHNRIPHWLTEGLAVMEEHRPRSYDWCRVLVNAIRHDELFTLESIDWGFMRPRRRHARTQAYAQSEWMCEYLIETHRPEVIHRMLAAFAAGKSQPEVFQEVVGVSVADFDKAFAEWAKQQAAGWGLDLTPAEDVEEVKALAEKEPTAAHFARLARAHFDAGDYDEALQAARKSVALDARDNPLGLEMLVRLLAEQARWTRAPAQLEKLESEYRPHAERLLELDPDNRVALLALAELELRADATESAEKRLARLHELAPDDPLAARLLAMLYLDGGKHREALELLRRVALTEEHDAEIPYQVAELEKRLGNPQAARAWYERTLALDPLSEKAHLRLAELHMQAGETADAAKLYEVLATLDPRNASYLSSAALAYHKLGDRQKAAALAERAVAIDPNVPAAALRRP